MLTLHRAALPPGLIPARLYDGARLARDPAKNLAELVRRGGLVGHRMADGAAIAAVDLATGTMHLIDGPVTVPAGNLLGLFYEPGAWSGILPSDERGRVTVLLEGAFDYHASMALEEALGGCRTMVESAMTVGTPVRATVPELVTFLGLLLDDTARFVARAETRDLTRLRRLARPHTRLRAIRLERPPVPCDPAPVDLARLVARAGTLTSDPGL